MSFFKNLQEKEVSPRTAIIAAGSLIIIAAIIITLFARRMSSTDSDFARKPTATKLTSVKLEIKETKDQSTASTSGSDKSKSEKAQAQSITPQSNDPYELIVQRNLFRALTSGGSGVGGPAMPQPAPVPTPMPVVQPMPVQPVPVNNANADDLRRAIAFTGIVETQSGKQALIENLQTGDSIYVSGGGSAFGYRILNISDNSIQLEKDGTQFSLNSGENKPDTNTGSRAPAAPLPGAPAQPTSPPNMPGNRWHAPR